jgi:HlyD family secretion protein
MRKGDSSLNMLIVAAILALGVGYYVPQTFSSKPAESAKADASAKGDVSAKADTSTKKTATSSKSAWAASAPGRVEPSGGEVRIGAQGPGRIAEVLVSLNDRVSAGDLMVRLDDDEFIGRVNSAVAEVAIRKRDRDNTDVSGKAQERRSAEDGVASAERQLVQAREEADRQLKARRAGSGSEAELDKARDAVSKAKDRLDQTRATLRKVQSADNLPAPTRPEAALVAARADLSQADAALERTRVRAAAAGTVLQVNAKTGETATPSPETALVIVGNLTALQVRAEIEERDIGKVRVGQTAIVRSDAFPGKDFEGKIASLAQILGPSRQGQRGPRKPTDVDVLEVLIDMVGQPALLPGMRVDVFLRPEATAGPASALQQQSAVSAPRAN